MEMLVFMEGGKLENPEKTLGARTENQQQTQPTYDTGTGNRTRAILVGGECSHRCAIPAPLLPWREGFEAQLYGSNIESNIGSNIGPFQSVVTYGLYHDSFQQQL